MMHDAKALTTFEERCAGDIVFGVNDCCITVADVIVAAGGPDLMARYRGRYKTKLGSLRLVRRDGFSSVDGAVAAEFQKVGEPVDEPANFDVAMIGYHDPVVGRRVSPAFYYAGRWNLRGERGLISVDQPNARAFRVI